MERLERKVSERERRPKEGQRILRGSRETRFREVDRRTGRILPEGGLKMSQSGGISPESSLRWRSHFREGSRLK